VLNEKYDTAKAYI